MLQNIIEFLLSLGEMINSFFQYIITFVADSVYILLTVFYVSTQIPSAFSWLPDEFVSLLVVLFAIVVIYKFCGRE